MLLNKKKIFLVFLLSILPTIQILNIHSVSSRSKDKNVHQNNIIEVPTKTTQTRHVAKFKSQSVAIGGSHLFQNRQNKNLATNSSVFLSNTASFKYQVDYSNYNNYGKKNSNFNVTVAKNTTNQIVNIGTNLISAITVKVSAPGQKWANLIITNGFTTSEDMIPTSIHWLVVGSKKINDASVSFNATYRKRENPKKLISVKVGYFNVSNISAKATHFIFGRTQMTILVGIVVGFIGGTYALYRAYSYWADKAADKATKEVIMMAEAAQRGGTDIIQSDGSYAEGKFVDKKFAQRSELYIRRSKVLDTELKLLKGTTKATQFAELTAIRGRMLAAQKLFVEGSGGAVVNSDSVLETETKNLSSSGAAETSSGVSRLNPKIDSGALDQSSHSSVVNPTQTISSIGSGQNPSLSLATEIEAVEKAPTAQINSGLNNPDEAIKSIEETTSGGRSPLKVDGSESSVGAQNSGQKAIQSYWKRGLIWVKDSRARLFSVLTKSGQEAEDFKEVVSVKDM